MLLTTYKKIMQKYVKQNVNCQEFSEYAMIPKVE